VPEQVLDAIYVQEEPAGQLVQLVAEAAAYFPKGHFNSAFIVEYGHMLPWIQVFAALEDWALAQV
jgi:hypothetical protein